MSELAERMQSVYVLFRNATTDVEREAVYRTAGIDFLNMRIELLAVLEERDKLRAACQATVDAWEKSKWFSDGPSAGTLVTMSNASRLAKAALQPTPETTKEK